MIVAPLILALRQYLKSMRRQLLDEGIVVGVTKVVRQHTFHAPRFQEGKGSTVGLPGKSSTRQDRVEASGKGHVHQAGGVDVILAGRDLGEVAVGAEDDRVSLERPRWNMGFGTVAGTY